MVDEDSFASWMREAGFETAGAAPYLDGSHDDLFRTYDGDTGATYEPASYLYAVFEDVLSPKDEMADVSVDDLSAYVESLEETEKKQLTARQRGFLASEQYRSRLDYWVAEGYFDADPES